MTYLVNFLLSIPTPANPAVGRTRPVEELLVFFTAVVHTAVVHADMYRPAVAGRGIGAEVRIYLKNNQAMKTQTGAEMGSVKTSSHIARSGSRAKSLPVKKLVLANSLVKGIDGSGL